MNKNRDWLIRKAEQEDGCFVSVGGPVDALEQAEQLSLEQFDKAKEQHNWEAQGGSTTTKTSGMGRHVGRHQTETGLESQTGRSGGRGQPVARTKSAGGEEETQAV